jgi:hypothetical protein
MNPIPTIMVLTWVGGRHPAGPARFLVAVEEAGTIRRERRQPSPRISRPRLGWRELIRGAEAARPLLSRDPPPPGGLWGWCPVGRSAVAAAGIANHCATKRHPTAPRVPGQPAPRARGAGTAATIARPARRGSPAGYAPARALPHLLPLHPGGQRQRVAWAAQHHSADA